MQGDSMGISQHKPPTSHTSCLMPICPGALCHTRPLSTFNDTIPEVEDFGLSGQWMRDWEVQKLTKLYRHGAQYRSIREYTSTDIGLV